MRPRLSELPECPLVEHAIQSIGIGGSYVTEGVSWVRKAVEAGLPSVTAQAFAHSTRERDLHRFVQGTGLKVELYNVPFLLDSPDSLKEVEIQVPILLPFELCHAIWEEGRVPFNNAFTGGFSGEGIAHFWATARQSAPHHDHPHIKDLSLLELAYKVPICFHVDGGEVWSNEEVCFWTCSSLLVRGNTYDCKFPWIAIPYMFMQSKKTKMRVTKQVANLATWITEIWNSGKLPHIGFLKEEFHKSSMRYKNRGQDIAGPYSGTYFCLKTDHKARGEQLNCHRNNSTL